MCIVSVTALLVSGLLVSCHQTLLPVYGAVSGAGSELDPQQGEAEPGDLLRPDLYVRNLTTQEGRSIFLQALYTPKQYRLLFDANGGHFSDGTTQKETNVTYNDGTLIYEPGELAGMHQTENHSLIQLPEPPQAENRRLAGWYLKGNQRPEQNASALDGPLIQEGSRYMIANDDPADLAATEHREDGTTIARALWKADQADVQDGNGADEKQPGTDGSGSEDPDTGKDLWDPMHSNNYVVEMTADAENKGIYEQKHGKIHCQYRRIYFNAETSLASAYHWSRRLPDTEEFQPLEESGSTYLADRLTRDDNGSVYRCAVEIGGSGAYLTYETAITVYYLPEIRDTEVQINGISA